MGQVERAVSVARQAVAITREIDSQMMLTLSLNYLGAALIAAGELVEARHTLIEAVQRAWDYKYFYISNDGVLLLCRVARVGKPQCRTTRRAMVIQ